MDTRVMDELFSSMTPDELAQADRHVRLLVWIGSLSDDEAAEWHRRILAWQRFVLDPAPSREN